MASTSSGSPPDSSSSVRKQKQKQSPQDQHQNQKQQQQDDSANSDNNSSPQFEFIGHDAPDGSRVRSHVMRGSWRARKLRASQKAAQRSTQEVKILAKKETTSSRTSPGRYESGSSQHTELARGSEGDAAARRRKSPSNQTESRTQSMSPRYNISQDHLHQPSTSPFSHITVDDPLMTPSNVDPLIMTPFELTPEDKALYQWRKLHRSPFLPLLYVVEPHHPY